MCSSIRMLSRARTLPRPLCEALARSAGASSNSTSGLLCRCAASAFCCCVVFFMFFVPVRYGKHFRTNKASTLRNIKRPAACLLRQYLYICTSKASNLVEHWNGAQLRVSSWHLVRANNLAKKKFLLSRDRLGSYAQPSSWNQARCALHADVC
jgi:hypothetical protein